MTDIGAIDLILFITTVIGIIAIHDYFASRK
jgi:hypothetical protein